MFNGIKNFFGNLFGGDDEDEKKKRQQQQAQQQRQNNQNRPAPSRPSGARPQNGQAPGVVFEPEQPQAPQKRPNNGVELFQLGNNAPEPLKKVAAQQQPKPEEKKAPADRRSALQKAGDFGRGVVKAAVAGEREFAKGIARVLPGGTADMDANAKMADEAATRAQQATADMRAGKISREEAIKRTRREADNTNQAVKGQAEIEKTMPTKKSIALGAASTAADIATAGTFSGIKGGTTLVKAANVGGRVSANAAAGGLNAAASNAGGEDGQQNLAAAAAAGAVFPEALRAIGKGLVKVGSREITPGASSSNPNQAGDAAQQEAERIAAEEATIRAQWEMRANNPPAKTLRPAAKMPDGGQNIVSPREIAGTNLRKVQAGDPTPAYQRQAADDEAAIAAQRADEQNADLLDTPAFERRGIELPGTAQEATDMLRTNAETFAARPESAELISNAYRETGGTNPLSLVAAALTRTQDKNQVRAIVQQLIPEADGNALNRAVNSVTGADDMVDVLDALQTAATRTSRGDLGPVSTAAAPQPQAPDMGAANPVATPPVAPVVANVNETPLPVDVPPVNVNENPAVAVPPTVSKSPDSDILPAQVINDDTVTPPQMPDIPGEQVPIAPRTHDALVKELGVGKRGDYNMRDAVNLEELKTRADGVIANMSDDDVLRAFQSADVDTMITDSNSLALARSALDRLGKMDTPEAAQQVKNIMDAMELQSSKSGQIMRMVQESFDSLPLPMKVRYLVKKIDAAWAKDGDYKPLRDDPERADIVEATITKHLKESQRINERVAQAQGQLTEIMDAVKRGEQAGSPDSIIKTLRVEKRNLAANNGELAKYYQTLVPKRSLGNRALVDFPKRMMLFNVTGRVNDLLTTAANITNLGAQNFTQGLLAKAVNMVKPGKVTDTWRGNRQFVQGTAEGVRQGAKEFGGTQYAPDVQKAIQGNQETRSGLQKAPGKFSRVVQAATEFATKASEGVADQRLYQLAYKEAAESGLKGADARTYAKARAAVPSPQMQEAAERLHLEMNNLQANPVTQALNRVSASIEGKSAVGGVIKNQIMPFTSWLGGNIYNTVTDKNVVAAAIKLGNSIRKGDTEGITRNMAKFANNAALTYALGYKLTEMGYITNENPQGYNDAGAYFHVGDRYIPVGAAGFFAPSVILGNAAHQALNNPDQESITERLGTLAEESLWNLGKSISLTSALGADNNIVRATQAATRPGGEPRDGAATAAAGAVGQFIPAVTGDVNAVLNNGLELGGMTIVPDSLNPTHEASDTKVSDPNSKSGTARDVPKSAAMGVVNRIPFASQQLPRKADVAADDLFDRAVRGDRESPGGKVAKAEKKSEAESAADRKKRGVPETEAAIEKKWQDGNFDLAIEGTKLHMAEVEKKGELSKSDREKFETSIRRMEVMRDKKVSYDDWTAYDKLDLADWRNLGDPEHESYNPDLYQKMYDIDRTMAAGKVSENADDKTKPKFYAKESKGGSGSGRSGGKSDADKAADAELRRIQSNTVDSPQALSKLSLGDLKPQKANSAKVPALQQIRSSELVKKRKISLSKA